MKKEAKADSAHICGYVNATEKKSKPIITPHGRVLEVIEPKAFERAIAKAYNITVNVDHDNSRIYASTKDGTLTVYEDAIGLYADVLIADKALINLASHGKIKGWSIGMRNVVDEIEPSASGLPVRHIKALDLDHITLLVDKLPAYSATSVEFRYSSKCEDPMMEYRQELEQIKQRKPKI